MVAASEGEFDRVTAHLDGHPAALNLCQLLTRTARSIAAGPIWVLGPESDLRLPFVHPEVLRAALRGSHEPAAGRAFYQDVLDAVAGPAVASLPSTNGPRPPGIKWYRPRYRSPAALGRIAESILAAEQVRALLGRRVLEALDDRAAVDQLMKAWPSRVIVLWADLFAEWSLRHADRLTWPAAAPW
jgi:hypothetical protein